MEKQKTAVDFYDQQLHILDLRLKSGSITIGEYFTLKAELFAQSKQMEKEQIIKAHKDSLGGGTDPRWKELFQKQGEEYYESIYGKN